MRVYAKPRYAFLLPNRHLVAMELSTQELEVAQTIDATQGPSARNQFLCEVFAQDGSNREWSSVSIPQMTIVAEGYELSASHDWREEGF